MSNKKITILFIAIAFLLLGIIGFTFAYYMSSTDFENEFNIVFVNKQNEGSITTGDEIAIGSEHFYVVSSDENETVLLAKYNLLVGNVFDYNYDTRSYTLNKTLSSSDTGYGLQNITAIGGHILKSENRTQFIGTVRFSDTNYWDNSICQYTGSTWGCTGEVGLLPEYSQNKETYYINPHNTDYPYVYRNNIGNSVAPNINYDNGWGNVQNNGYTISYYVEKYVGTLKTLGAPDTITGRLLSEEEAVNLGCSESDNYCSSEDYENNPTAGTAPSWVYSTSYWLGSAYYSNYMWGVLCNGYWGDAYFSEDNIYGVRPAIMIQTSFI